MVMLLGVLRRVALILRVLEVVAEREGIEEEYSGDEHLQADQQVLYSLHKLKYETKEAVQKNAKHAHESKKNKKSDEI